MAQDCAHLVQVFCPTVAVVIVSGPECRQSAGACREGRRVTVQCVREQHVRPVVLPTWPASPETALPLPHHVLPANVCALVWSGEQSCRGAYVRVLHCFDRTSVAQLQRVHPRLLSGEACEERRCFAGAAAERAGAPAHCHRPLLVPPDAQILLLSCPSGYFEHQYSFLRQVTSNTNSLQDDRASAFLYPLRLPHQSAAEFVSSHRWRSDYSSHQQR